MLVSGSARAGDAAHRVRFRAALVTTEIALSLVLLVGAALMLRSVSALRDVDPGFDAHNVLTMRLAPSSDGYADPARWLALYDEMVAQTRALPAVEAVGLNNALPLFSGSYDSGVLPEGRADTRGNREPALVLSAGPDFFRAMGIQLVRGRYFRVIDANVAVYRMQTMEDVVNQYLATVHLLEQLLGIFAGLALVLAALGIYEPRGAGVRHPQRGAHNSAGH